MLQTMNNCKNYFRCKFINIVELVTKRRTKYTVCWFGYPLPPLNKTMIFEPLESDVEKYKNV